MKEIEIEVNGEKLWMDYKAWWKEKKYLDWLTPYALARISPTEEEREKFLEDLEIEWNKITTQKNM